MRDARVDGLIEEALRLRYSRRQIFRRAALFGLSTSAIMTVLAACGESADEVEPPGSDSPDDEPATDEGATAPAGAGSTGDSLVIWWPRGYYPEEDAAFEQIISDWEENSGVSVDLTFVTGSDLPTRLVSAVGAGAPPDLSWVADWELGPRFAWNGELVDVSDVVSEVEDDYTEAALQAANLVNNATGERSYYVIPFEQQTMHAHYWRPLLDEAGISELPTDWDGFWGVWGEAQETLRGAGHGQIFGIGFPMSSGATDTFYTFQQILEAFEIQFMDEEGNFQFDDATRAGIAQAMEWYTSFYENGIVPPGAVNWLDPDNNVNFLNQTTIMTPNPSLSIPAHLLDEGDEDAYLNDVATLAWPNGPTGNEYPFRVSIKSGAIFERGANADAAKDFMRFLIQPDIIKNYLQGSLGRWYPVMPEVIADPYWSDTDNPHLQVATAQFEQSTRPFEMTLNPAYSEVLGENVWGNALGQILVADASPEQATDQAISRMEQIVSSWNPEG